MSTACGSSQPAARARAAMAAPAVDPARADSAALANPRPDDAVLVDGVAAVVGHEVILLSDVEERLRFYQTQLTAAERDTLDLSSLRDRILDSMINDRLLVAEAQRAGIDVSTAEVTEGVEAAMERIRSNFPSEEAFLEEIAREGLQVSDLRQSYREIVRRQLLAQRVVQSSIQAGVGVTDEEVREFFKKNRDELPDLPARVVLDHILITPQPSEETLAAIREEIGEIKRRLAEGESFADLARLHSQAPGATTGGQLGTFRRGDLDRGFAAIESTAFALSPGEVGGPVESSLGLHLVRVDSRDGDRVTASQILLRSTPSHEDSVRARGRVQEIYQRLEGGESFEALAKEFSDDRATAESGGRLGTFPWDGLTEIYRKRLADLQPGAVTDPIESPQGFQIVRLVSREEARTPAFDEIAGEIRAHLRDQKANQAYLDWIAELRDKIYIRVVRTPSPDGSS